MLADDTILFLEALLFCSGISTIDYTVVTSMYGQTPHACAHCLQRHNERTQLH